MVEVVVVAAAAEEAVMVVEVVAVVVVVVVERCKRGGERRKGNQRLGQGTHFIFHIKSIQVLTDAARSPRQTHTQKKFLHIHFCKHIYMVPLVKGRLACQRRRGDGQIRTEGEAGREGRQVRRRGRHESKGGREGGRHEGRQVRKRRRSRRRKT